MTHTTVRPGQVWREKLSSSTWRVVSLSVEGTVGMSGPGPCRAMLYISVDDLENGWVLEYDSSTMN